MQPTNPDDELTTIVARALVDLEGPVHVPFDKVGRGRAYFDFLSVGQSKKPIEYADVNASGKAVMPIQNIMPSAAWALRAVEGETIMSAG